MKTLAKWYLDKYNNIQNLKQSSFDEMGVLAHQANLELIHEQNNLINIISPSGTHIVFAAPRNNPAVRTVLLIIENDNVVGEIVIDRIAFKQAIIQQVYIYSNYRNKKYGQTLLMACLEYAKKHLEHPTITLRVARDNDVARHIYVKQGFHLVSSTEDVLTLGISRY